MIPIGRDQSSHPAWYKSRDSVAWESPSNRRTTFFSKLESKLFPPTIITSSLIMGRTNVRSGHEFLARAGGSHESPSVMPELGNQPVLIWGYNLSQDDLDEHVSTLRYAQNDSWMEAKRSTTDDPYAPYAPCSSDQPMAIPKVHVTRGLKWPQLLYGEHKDKPQPELSDLLFVLIVQGRGGSARSKLVKRVDLKQAGAEMFFESANGFSVVFSGAMLKKDWEKRGDTEYTFQAVASFWELFAMEEEVTRKVIGVVC